MTFPEMQDKVLARSADIGEHPDDGGSVGDDKAMGVGGIMKFRECGNGQPPYGDGRIGLEGGDEMIFDGEAALLPGAGGDIDGQLVLFCNDGNAFDMVVMLVRDKYGPDLFKGQAEAAHAFFRLAAGEAGIDKDCFLIVADVIAIPIATGIQ